MAKTLSVHAKKKFGFTTRICCTYFPKVCEAAVAVVEHIVYKVIFILKNIERLKVDVFVLFACMHCIQTEFNQKNFVYTKKYTKKFSWPLTLSKMILLLLYIIIIFTCMQFFFFYFVGLFVCVLPNAQKKVFFYFWHIMVFFV